MIDLDTVKAAGGGTYSVNYNPAVPLTAGCGFGVSLAGYEQQSKELTLAIVQAFVNKHKHLLLLAEKGTEQTYLGLWFCEDSRVWYLDISEFELLPEVALKKAKERNQKAYWDFKNSAAILV